MREVIEHNAVVEGAFLYAPESQSLTGGQPNTNQTQKYQYALGLVLFNKEIAQHHHQRRHQQLRRGQERCEVNVHRSYSSTLPAGDGSRLQE